MATTSIDSNLNTLRLFPINDHDNSIKINNRKEGVVHFTYQKNRRISHSQSDIIINKEKEKDNHKDKSFLIENENSKKEKGTFTSFRNEQRKSLKGNLIYKSTTLSRNNNLINSSSKHFLSKHATSFVRNLMNQHVYQRNQDRFINSSNDYNSNNQYETSKQDYEAFKYYQSNHHHPPLADTLYNELTGRTHKTGRNKRNTKDTDKKPSLNKSPSSPLNSDEVKIHSNRTITSLLNQKNISDIPVLIPTYISINNQYDTMSEKRRHEHTMNQFIKLKWRTIQNPSKAHAYIAEFFLLNNVTGPETHTKEALDNFNLFLDKDFQFDPKKTIQDIITEGIYYCPPPGYEHKKVYEDPYSNEWCHINTHHKSLDTKMLNTTNQYDTTQQRQQIIFKSRNDKNKCAGKQIDYAELHRKLVARTQQKDLKNLVNELEGEIVKANNQGKAIVKASKKNYPWSPICINKPSNNDDHNKYVPNLCLSTAAVKLNILKKMEERKNSNEEKYKRRQKIKEINQRLYYDSCLKENDFNMDNIKRHSKLTEYIILERSKRALSLEEHTINIKGINDVMPFKFQH